MSRLEGKGKQLNCRTGMADIGPYVRMQMVGWLVSISNSNLLCYIQICGFSVYTQRKTWIHRRANTVCTPCAFNVCPMCQQCAQVTLTSKHSLGKCVCLSNKLEHRISVFSFFCVMRRILKSRILKEVKYGSMDPWICCWSCC